METAAQLDRFSPEYFSITYGAGGSTQAVSLQTVTTLKAAGYEVAPHLSCIGATRAHVLDVLQHYQAQGIRRLIALRGDLPSGQGTLHGDFHYARDLVAFIREETGEYFDIAVAAYPESHPQSLNMTQELQHFKAKVAAGANTAITQYFYHPHAYVQWREDCVKAGIEIPLIPGIMPIYRFTQLARFSAMCGAEIPQYVRKRMEAFGDDTASIQALGVEIVTRLCEDLLREGAPGLHFYTLNQHHLVGQVIQYLGGS